MACGCASRMRTYVLPLAGYVELAGVWVNPKMPDDLQVIGDDDVAKHHGRLTARIAVVLGIQAFNEIWRRTTGSVLSDDTIHALQERGAQPLTMRQGG